MSEYKPDFVAARIKAILKSRRITAKQMLLDCGMNKNALFTMQTRGNFPRLDAVAQMADYLDCSVDYLLGRTDKPDVNR